MSSQPTPDREDEAIGQAFRWSVLALVFIIAASLALYWVNRPGDAQPGVSRVTSSTATNLVPAVRFTDITAAAGITFVHTNGAYGEKLLPETMGGGVAFFDFDNDGDADLLFINCRNWPWRESGDPQPRSALYRNDTAPEGQVRFTDVTPGSGLDVALYGMGVAVGDYDGDGRVDVFVSAVGGNRLFHNEGGGKFRDVTTSAGVGGAADAWSTSSAWLDYDNDGDLDLFVCNYVQWSRELDREADYQLVGIGRAYGPPMNFPGTFPYLYRNDGKGRFTDVSATSGVQVRHRATNLPLAKSLGVAPVDIDGDGWIDLIVANDTVRNFVFRNERNGTFKEAGELSGLAYDRFGGTRGAMGIDAGRFQNEDTLGILIGNFANEMTALYVSRRDMPVFTDEAIVRGVGDATRDLLTFGVFFFDYDLDGWLDLLTANGHIEEDIAKAQPGQRYRQPTQLFWNAGAARQGGGFVPVTAEQSGGDLFQPVVGRGGACADVDGDGDLDVVVTQVNGPPLLLRNDQAPGHHWVRFSLRGGKSNRDAIGAWIEARVGAHRIAQQVMPSRGYLSQSELPVTIGLGAATKVDEVTIRWPGGTRQKLDPGTLKLDSMNVVDESR